MNSRIKLGDLEVNRLGYGAMRVCGPSVWGPPKDRANALRVLRRAVELGVNFFDTADSYGPYVDEELIAEALHPYPKGFVIATNVYHRTAQGWRLVAHHASPGTTSEIQEVSDAPSVLH